MQQWRATTTTKTYRILNKNDGGVENRFVDEKDIAGEVVVAV
ncbi:hypothetical protein [Candidatus Endomicrobiellum pyrsonymphae]